MSSSAGTAEDAVRGWLLALTSAALAIAAHGVAGGALADAGFTVLLATLLAWGGAALARRGGPLTLLGVLGVIQLSQHLLLTEIAGGHGHTAPVFDGWVMFAVHAVATVLTACLLRRAGTALGVVSLAVAWLVRRLTALVAGPVRTAPVAAASPLAARPGQLIEVLFREVHPRRGPPVHS